MVVQRCEAQVLIGKMSQALERVINRQIAVADSLQ